MLEKSGVYCTIETKDSSYTDDRFKNFLRACPLNHANSELLWWKEDAERDQYRSMAEYKDLYQRKSCTLCWICGIIQLKMTEIS